jgi:hypothetical protein
MEPSAILDLSGGATLLLSLAGSSVIAAVVSGYWSRNNARDEQLRLEMLDVAGSFAGGAMEALARIRDFKPTKRKAGESHHRNEPLWTDAPLRSSRRDGAAAAIDRLRPIRGQVHLIFADSSGSRGDLPKHAGRVISHLRIMLEVSSEFWDCCDEELDKRYELEAAADKKYAAARDATWRAIDSFCTAAADRMRSP